MASAPAQAPVEGSITTAAPGGGVMVDDVTSQYLEFEVLADHDNATMQGVATPAQSADLDLYLDRQGADGSWTQVAGGTNNGDLDGEEIATGRLLPGIYRLEVHNFLGPPGNEVAIRVDVLRLGRDPGS